MSRFIKTLALFAAGLRLMPGRSAHAQATAPSIERTLRQSLRRASFECDHLIRWLRFHVA